MTSLYEAAEMALEALDGWNNYNKWVWPESALEQAKKNTAEAIQALRQALDKPEIDPKVLVDMAVLAEREACAKLVGEWDTAITDMLATAIRERGER